MNLSTGGRQAQLGRHRSEAEDVAPLSGIPAPPARFSFGYHTSFALTSAGGIPSAAVLSPSNHDSNHGHSAIHMQRLAGHVAGFVRSQKSHRGRDLFRRSGPVRRNFRDDDFALLVVELVGHRGD